MSITITTKYYGATNTRGARIQATPDYGKSVSIPYPYELSGIECHAAAVKAWLKKYGLNAAIKFCVGDSKGGGFVFVQDANSVTIDPTEA